MRFSFTRRKPRSASRTPAVHCSPFKTITLSSTPVYFQKLNCFRTIAQDYGTPIPASSLLDLPSNTTRAVLAFCAEGGALPKRPLRRAFKIDSSCASL
jgi:hypothetical protein